MFKVGQEVVDFLAAVGRQAVLAVGTVVVVEGLVGLVAAEEQVVPGTVAVALVGIAVEAGLVVVVVEQAVLDPLVSAGTVVAGELVGLGIVAVVVLGTAVEAGLGTAEAEEVDIPVVGWEAGLAQTEDELAGLGPNHAWAHHSCPCLAWGDQTDQPGGEDSHPEDNLQGDQSLQEAWQGCWGRGNPVATDPSASSSAPLAVSAAQTDGTPLQ